MDVEDIFKRADDLKLRDTYVGFKRDFVHGDMLLIRVSCVHPADNVTRVQVQWVYEKFAFPMQVAAQLQKLKNSTMQPLERIKKP